MDKIKEVVDLEEVKERKPVKQILKENKKKIFVGLGLVGAFIAGAVAHAKFGGDDEEKDDVFGDPFEDGDTRYLVDVTDNDDKSDIEVTEV